MQNASSNGCRVFRVEVATEAWRYLGRLPREEYLAVQETLWDAARRAADTGEQQLGGELISSCLAAAERGALEVVYKVNPFARTLTLLEVRPYIARSSDKDLAG